LSRPLKFVPEVAVLGTGSVQASRRISNAALQGMVSNYDKASGSFPAWVERVTHIQSRGFCADGETTASMGLRAGLLAVEDAGLRPKDVDTVLLCSFTMDEIYPGDSVDIAKEFGPKCGSITLSGGCAGSVYGIGMALSMVKSGFARNVLVVGSEHISACMNMGDPITAILFGDGAGAVVVGRRENPEPETGFIDKVCLRHDFSPKNIYMGNANLALPGRLLGPSDRSRTGNAVEQQYIVIGSGARVLRNAVTAMAESTAELLGYGPEALRKDDPGLRAALDRIHLVPHQANGRIVDGVQEKLGLHEDRVYRTVYHTGNMSAATNVYTLDYARREGNLKRRERPDGTGEITPCGRKLKKGDLVVMTAVGAGYIYGAVGFRL
jgi:3-oxoacyl-[acyl-carrier-protein] synthase-3